MLATLRGDGGRTCQSALVVFVAITPATRYRLRVAMHGQALNFHPASLLGAIKNQVTKDGEEKIRFFNTFLYTCCAIRGDGSKQSNRQIKLKI